MSRRAEPITYLWWLVSRASGIIGLLLITLSVLVGLAMASRVLRRPAFKRAAARLHEHVALAALLAIGAHGLALLGDHWLRPGWRGIAVPFAMSYRPPFTGIGIIGGYLALLLGPSFYLRRRIGARRWRKLHRGIVLTWILSVFHTLGAGSDASALWLRVLALAPAVPVVYLFVLRILRADVAATPHRPVRPSAAATRGAARARPRLGSAQRVEATSGIEPCGS